MKIVLNISDSEVKISKKDKKCFLKLAKKTFSILKIRGKVEFSLNFIALEEIRNMNKKYRNIDKQTDVLSFSVFEELSLEEKKAFLSLHGSRDLGDIFICKDVAIKQSKSHGHSFKREVCFLFVHGLLHLLGYDHKNKDEEESMFSLQEQILEKTKC